MTDLTDEQLDKARDAEVLRIVSERWRTKHGAEALETAVMEVLDERRRLDVSGWQPTPPVDPVILAVREIVARIMEGLGYLDAAARSRQGARDSTTEMLCALAAYRVAPSVSEGRYRSVIGAAKELREYVFAKSPDITSSIGRRVIALDAVLSALEQSDDPKTMGVGE